MAQSPLVDPLPQLLQCTSTPLHPLPSTPTTHTHTHTSTQALVLQSNQLTVLPDQLCGCVGLRLLDLSHNALRALPSGLGALSRLKSLKLHHNALPSVPRGLSCLGALTELLLSHNPLPLQVGARVKCVRPLWLGWGYARECGAGMKAGHSEVRARASSCPCDTDEEALARAGEGPAA